MASDRWDPFREAVSLRDAMNALLQESFVRPGARRAPAVGTLPLDIAETENELRRPGVAAGRAARGRADHRPRRHPDDPGREQARARTGRGRPGTSASAASARPSAPWPSPRRSTPTRPTPSIEQRRPDPDPAEIGAGQAPPDQGRHRPGLIRGHRRPFRAPAGARARPSTPAVRVAPAPPPALQQALDEGVVLRGARRRWDPSGVPSRDCSGHGPARGCRGPRCRRGCGRGCAPGSPLPPCGRRRPAARCTASTCPPRSTRCGRTSRRSRPPGTTSRRWSCSSAAPWVRTPPFLGRRPRVDGPCRARDHDPDRTGRAPRSAARSAREPPTRGARAAATSPCRPRVRRGRQARRSSAGGRPTSTWRRSLPRSTPPNSSRRMCSPWRSGSSRTWS